MASRLWFKVWLGWYTSNSHESLSADAIHVGPVLMSFVRWSPGSDAAWAELENGKPIPLTAIAKRARWEVSRTEAALLELVGVNTAKRRKDGAWGFPKYGAAQETADAARKRKVRGQSEDIPAPVEVEKEQSSSPSGKGSGKSKSRPKPAVQLDVRAVVVIDRIDAHRVRLELRRLWPSERIDKHIVARLDEGVPIEELLDAVDARADEVERKPECVRWFDATSPFTGPASNGKPGGWAVSCRTLDEFRRRKRASGNSAPPSTYQHIDDINAQRDAEDARGTAQ